MIAKQLPNAISACRLLATPALLWLALGEHPAAFAGLLIACLLSDIVDGLLARTFALQSRLGAILDSVADALVAVIAAVGVMTYQREFVRAHQWWLLVLLGMYVGEIGASLLRYGRLSSFHTYLIRASAYLQGIFFAGLFVWGHVPWLFAVMMGVSCVAYAEEFVLLALLPAWTHDVGGLWWVPRSKRQAA